MYANAYADAVESWKTELIARRARRFGLRGADVEEVQQEIVLHVLEFEFDPRRAHGATPETALTALIDHHVKNWLRDRGRYQARIDRWHHACPRETSVCDVDRHALQIDVREAVAQLSDDERAVCEALSRGESLTEIARHVGCGWHTLRRAVERIRCVLRDAGLEAWVVE